jgi:hypothetical protein
MKNWSKLSMLAAGLITTLTLFGGCAGEDAREGGHGLEAGPDISTEVPTGEESTAESSSELRTGWHCINGSCVSFETYGDHLFVNDNALDHHSAVGQIKGQGYCWNPNGVDTTVDCNFNTPEADIFFRPCVGEYGSRTILSCSSVWSKVSAKN